jgi:prolyl oligopeptidase
MNKIRSIFAFLCVAAVLTLAAVAPFLHRAGAQSVAAPSGSAGTAPRPTTDGSKLVYPPTKKGEHVDDYFGTKVPDPYRWLEDETSAQTKAWVEDQNRVTFAYLEEIPYREKLKARLTELYNYPRISAPFRRGETYFFTKNDGLQNQNVYYIQKGVNGTPEVFLDPNKFSTDGTSVLSAFSLSKDGQYVAYGISQGGSDWVTLHVMEVDSRQKLSDEIQWSKASGVAWQGNGFYYSRYPEPEKGKELSSKNEFQTVYFHKVGTPQSDDVVIYEDKANPQRFHNVGTTEDERFAILTISERGKGKQGNALYYKDLSKDETKFSSITATVSSKMSTTSF